MIRFLSRTAGWAIVILLVVSASVLTAAQYLLPEIQVYRGVLEEKVSDILDVPVQIGELQGGMRGFYPQLVLSDVHVLDSKNQQSPLRFEQIDVGIDLLNLIARRTLKPRWISVVGAQITIVRDKDGNFSVAGLSPRGKAPTWLFEDGRFELLSSGIYWQDKKQDSPILHFPDVALSINNKADYHKIRLSAHLSDELGEELTVAVNYHGDIFGQDCCDGRLFVEGKQIHLEKLFSAQTAMDYEINSGFGDFRFWSNLTDLKPRSVYGQVDLSNPIVTALGEMEKPPVALKALNGWFRWKQNTSGWRIDVKRLNIETDDHTWPTSQLAVEAITDSTGGLLAVDAVASYLRIGDLAKLIAATDVLTDVQIEKLAQMSPNGVLHDFALNYTVAADGSGILSGCGEIESGGVKALDQYPGVKGFTGFLCSDPGQGVLVMESGAAEFEMPSLFRQPIALKRLSGAIQWERQPGGWRINSDAARVVTPDLDLAARFDLLKTASSDAPFLELRLDGNLSDAKSISRYLPVSKMKRGLVKWLDNAFSDGSVDDARLLFFGKVNEFPFDSGQGVLKSRFEVKNTALRYHRNWLPITDVDAEVTFHNQEVSIHARSGKLSGSSIKDTVFRFHDIRGKTLLVEGKVNGEIAQTLDFLYQSPLEQSFGPLMGIADFGGKNAIKVNLEIHLVKNAKPSVDGVAKLRHGAINLGGIDLAMTGIDGNLFFTADTLSAKDIRGVLLDSPSLVQLSTVENDFRLKLGGEASITSLSQQFPFSFWDNFEGKTGYQIFVNIPKKRTGASLSTGITVKSDLRGVSLLLPQPLGKTEEELKSLKVDFSVAKSKKTPARIRYDGIVDADLVFSEPGSKPMALERGSVSIREDGKRAANEPGLNFFIQLDELTLDQWLSWYRSKKRQGTGPGINRVELEAANIFWRDQNFGPGVFKLGKKGVRWEAEIQNQYAKGRIRAPTQRDEDSFLSMDFDFLKIPKMALASSENANQLMIDPGTLPNLNLTSKQLHWHKMDLGSVELRTQADRQGMAIDHIKLRSDNHKLSAKGRWLKAGSKNLTDLNGSMTFKDLGGFLRDAEISEEVKDTEAKIGFELEWSDPLYRLSAETLNGHVSVKFKEGRLLAVDPGIGRALGVLNLDTWYRRLTLDFSDLYAAGLAYDKISSDFYIKDGDAYTNKLFIDAVAARIYGSGRIGLAAHDFDQVIRVIPKGSASLPIAGAIAGGPAVGAAVYVAQKLIGSNVDSIAGTQYSLKGPWSDPDVTRLPGRGGMLDRAWNGIKGIAGRGSENVVSQEKNEN